MASEEVEPGYQLIESAAGMKRLIADCSHDTMDMTPFISDPLFANGGRS